MKQLAFLFTSDTAIAHCQLNEARAKISIFLSEKKMQWATMEVQD